MLVQVLVLVEICVNLLYLPPVNPGGDDLSPYCTNGGRKDGLEMKYFFDCGTAQVPQEHVCHDAMYRVSSPRVVGV